MEKINCPVCNGHKEIVGMFPVYDDSVPVEKRRPTVAIRCYLCGGSGEVDEGYPDRKDRGERLRSLRVNAGVALRGFCITNRLSSVTVSRFECGAVVDEVQIPVILAAYEGLPKTDL